MSKMAAARETLSTSPLDIDCSSIFCNVFRATSLANFFMTNIERSRSHQGGKNETYPQACHVPD